MTKQGLIDLIKKSEEGEQLVPVNLGLEGGDSAISLEKIKYRNKDYYDIGFDIRDSNDGEPIDIDLRILVGGEFLNYLMDSLTDEVFDEIVTAVSNELSEKKESMEEVPAE